MPGTAESRRRDGRCASAKVMRLAAGSPRGTGGHAAPEDRGGDSGAMQVAALSMSAQHLAQGLGGQVSRRSGLGLGFGLGGRRQAAGAVDGARARAGGTKALRLDLGAEAAYLALRGVGRGGRAKDCGLQPLQQRSDEARAGRKGETQCGDVRAWIGQMRADAGDDVGVAQTHRKTEAMRGGNSAGVEAAATGRCAAACSAEAETQQDARTATCRAAEGPGGARRARGQRAIAPSRSAAVADGQLARCNMRLAIIPQAAGGEVRAGRGSRRGPVLPGGAGGRAQRAEGGRAGRGRPAGGRSGGKWAHAGTRALWHDV